MVLAGVDEVTSFPKAKYRLVLHCYCIVVLLYYYSPYYYFVSDWLISFFQSHGNREPRRSFTAKGMPPMESHPFYSPLQGSKHANWTKLWCHTNGIMSGKRASWSNEYTLCMAYFRKLLKVSTIFVSLVNRTFIVNVHYFHDFIRYPRLKRIY